MYIVLTLLKAIVIIVGMEFLIKKTFISKSENRLWTFFKIIAIIFSILMLITLVEFILLMSHKTQNHTVKTPDKSRTSTLFFSF